MIVIVHVIVYMIDQTECSQPVEKITICVWSLIISFKMTLLNVAQTGDRLIPVVKQQIILPMCKIFNRVVETLQ